MFTLYDNIKRLCDDKGVTPSKMCLDIGKSKSLISSLKTGKTTGINSETAHLMADYFGVPVDEVLHGIKKDPADMTISEIDDEVAELLEELRDNPETRALLHVARNAKPEDIRAVADLLKRLKGTEQD